MLYFQGYIKRQALYACLTCCSDAKFDPSKRAAVCLACSLTCHDNHELVELYTKRNFRCDCGNPKFNSHPCQFTPDKTSLNEDNKYNQNFSGLYCVCHKPYPDPEAPEEDEMIQCIICEDWLHSEHLEADVPPNDQYAEMICKLCMEQNDFLHDYTCYAINSVENTEENISVTDINVNVNGTDENNLKKDVNKDDSKNEIDAASDSNICDKTGIEPNVNLEDSEANTEEVDKENITMEKSEAKEMIVDESTDVKIANDINTDDEKNKDADEKAVNNNDEYTGSNDLVDEVNNKEPNFSENPENMKDQSLQETSDVNKEDTEDSLTDKNEEATEKSTEENINKNDSNNDDKKVDETDTIGIKNISVTEDDHSNKDPCNINENNITNRDNENENKEESEISIENKMDESEATTQNKENDESEINEENNIDNESETNINEKKDETEIHIDNKEVSEICEKKDEQNGESESKSEKTTETESLNETETKLNENKRKLSTEEELVDEVAKKPKLEDLKCQRPRGSKKIFKGATFWDSNFRQKLCTCAECIIMYKDLSVMFLIDPEDTAIAYETLGKEMVDGSNASQYEKGLQALSSLDRVQQINALTEYNKMRDKLLDFLKSFKERKEIVKEEDIKAFFAGMKPHRESDGVYFCR